MIYVYPLCDYTSIYQEESSNPLTTTVYVGPNCDVEYETEIGEVCPDYYHNN